MIRLACLIEDLNQKTVKKANSKTKLRPIVLLGFAIPLSLLPLFLWREQFTLLFWFGDEWDLLDQISRQGFWPWTLGVFAENFVPLFKILWGGLLVAGGGNYMAMIISVWMTHFLVVLTFGLLMGRAGFSLFSTITSMGLLGLSASNVETLAWSVQWSSVLSAFFFLVGALVLTRRSCWNEPLNWQERLVVFGLSAASALCFSRGVLTGIALAIFLFCQPFTFLRKNPAQRICDLACCLTPGVTIAVVIFLSASGNHRANLSYSQFLSVVEFAATYLAANPFWRLLNLDLAGWNWSVWLAVGFKIGIATVALILASPMQLRLLWMLIALDFGNAVMLGIGRYHTGVPAACSLRYQYFSLICSLPFLATLLQWIFNFRKVWPPLLANSFLKATTVVVLFITAVWQWPERASWFGNARGRVTRDQLSADSAWQAAECSLPGMPFLPLKRGAELTKQFRLH